jgi:hypothetical protein
VLLVEHGKKLKNNLGCLSRVAGGGAKASSAKVKSEATAKPAAKVKSEATAKPAAKVKSEATAKPAAKTAKPRKTILKKEKAKATGTNKAGRTRRASGAVGGGRG